MWSSALTECPDVGSVMSAGQLSLFLFGQLAVMLGIYLMGRNHPRK